MTMLVLASTRASERDEGGGGGIEIGRRIRTKKADKGKMVAAMTKKATIEGGNDEHKETQSVLQDDQDDQLILHEDDTSANSIMKNKYTKRNLSGSQLRIPIWPSDFKWDGDKIPAGYNCIQIHERAEPWKHAWHDNYFCWRHGTQNPGMKWSQAGPISNMRCTKINEPADPHAWQDNYLCVPKSSHLQLSWSYAGAISGKNCIQWHESQDPHSWQDNYLCSEYDGGSTILDQSSHSCPSSMFLSKEDCRSAGLAVGGVLLDREIKEGSWSTAPHGCSINFSNGNYVLYNSFHGTNNGNYQPVCGKGSFTYLPNRKGLACPLSMSVSKEDCVAAGLSVGGRLRNGKELVEGSWGHTPFGCYIEADEDNAIHYNNNQKGTNDGRYRPICYELPFVKMHGLSKCPLDSAVSKEECIAAGLSLGGKLLFNQLIVDAWDDKPNGCIIAKGSNIIHYNDNPVGKKNDDSVLVCNTIEVEEDFSIPGKSGRLFQFVNI